MQRIIFLCVLSLGFLVASAFPSYAGGIGSYSFNVNITTDSDDANPGNGVCADGTGQCSLRAAIREANALSPSIVTINVPAGTYNLTITYGAEEDASASNDLDIANSGSTTIQGTGTTAQDVVVNAFTIAHRAFDVMSGATLSLNKVTVTNGVASSGGGIRVNAGGSLNLDHVIITGNQANSGAGGGIYNAGTITGTVVSITSNTASSEGGGLYLFSGANNSVTLTRSLLSGNSAPAGGGISNGGNHSYTSPVGGYLHLENTTVGGNTATSSGGGGILLNQGSSAYFVNCTIAKNINSGGASGAGVCGNGANSFFFLNTLVAGNTNSSGVNNCYQIALNSLGWKDLNSAYFDQGVPYGYSMSDDSSCASFTTSSNILLDTSLTTDAALAGAGAYKLQSGSAAIDAGDSSNYAAVDVFGTARPQDAGPDIGAYEFIIDNEPPTTPVLSSPSGGAIVMGSSVTLYWQESTDPEGSNVTYRLQIAEDADFTVNLQEYEIDGNGALIAGVMFPFLLLPGWLAANRKKHTVMLMLTAILLAATFFVGCSGGGGSSHSNRESTVSYRVSGLQYNTTYYWRVIAVDEDGAASVPSEVRSFTTQDA